MLFLAKSTLLHHLDTFLLLVRPSMRIHLNVLDISSKAVKQILNFARIGFYENALSSYCRLLRNGSSTGI